MKREDVKKYNGENGLPAYIIYDGKVYDVTESRLWKKGIHMGRHKAGEDLTSFISMAPHNEKVLEKVKYVCDVEEEELFVDKKDRWREFYRKYHFHPIFVHYPMGILYFGAFMLLLWLITGEKSFETASFYALITGTAAIFPTALSGLFSWYINYEKTLTKIFKNKIVYSIILIVITCSISLIRLIEGAGLYETIYCYIYVTGYFLSIPVMTFVAYNGGRITWPE